MASTMDPHFVQHPFPCPVKAQPPPQPEESARPANVPAEPASPLVAMPSVRPPATAQTEAGGLGASIDPQELPQAADGVVTPAAPMTGPYQGSPVKGSRSRLPMPKISAGMRVQIGKGSVPQSLQHIVPHSLEDRDRLRRAMAQTWQFADKYSFDFETTNIIVLGQQSSGKTSWIERFLQFGFSKVDVGMATTRPAMITICPKRDPTKEGTITITIIEEFPGGAKSEPETLRDVPGGESALTQLFNWCAKKNTRTPLKEKIFITIETEKCDTPKRIMDLPGVRATDGSNPEDEGVNEAIVEMVTDELKKPNSMVICLAEARSDPLNDNMLKVLQRSQAIDHRGDLHTRLLLVLTKSDQWFGDVGCAEDVRRQLRSWQKEFFCCEPMLVGYTFDHKEMKGDKGLESRNRQYRKACEREAEAVQLFRRDMMLDTEEDLKYWNEKVTFKKVKEIVMDFSLDMDWANLNKSIEQIQHRQLEVQDKLDQLRRELKSHDLEELKDKAERLVDTMLGETVKFLTAVPGPGREQFLSRPGALKEAKTLIQEEEEFLDSRWEYNFDAMLEASQAKRAHSIDYNRTDEHAPGHFDQFYREMLKDKNFIQCVPGFDDRLTAGAGTRRAKEFFRLLSLLFMHPDENDRDRILNCTAMNPDMPNLEDDMTRVYEVLKGKAATMREIAQYFVQKIVHMGVKCLSYAWTNMKESTGVQRPIIDKLAGNLDVDEVFKPLRRGFLKEFLCHAQHAYTCCISDHALKMHHLGAFGRDQVLLLPEGVDEAEIREATKTYDQAREKLVKVNLPRHFEDQYPDAWAGVKEGLLCINKTGWCDQVPNLTGRFIESMIACKVLKAEMSEARNLQEYEDISDRLERMNPNRQNKFFGKIAVLFALMSPGFVMDVEERCCSGLLGSPLNQFYRHNFVKSMREEVFKAFVNGEKLEAMRQNLALKVRKLEGENEALKEALKSLREIKNKP